MLDRLRFEREVALLVGPPKAQPRPVVASPKAAPPASPKTCIDRLKATRVAVVGGGLAGLMSAHQLGEKGAKVTLFEARPKVGGRVLSSTKFAAGRIIEEGAELIGSFHTSWLKLALRYRLTMVSRMDAELYDHEGLRLKMKLDGNILTNAQYFDLSRKMEDTLALIAEKAHQLQFDPSQPWNSPAVSGFDRESVAHALEHSYHVPPGSLLWKMLEWLLVNDEVSQLDRMNHLGLLCKVKAGQGARLGTVKCPSDEDQCKKGYWEELEIFRCADGCETLAKKMSSEIQQRFSGTVRVGTAVTNIHIGDAGVLIGTKRASADGKVAGDPAYSYYDYVVLTAPPTVWDRIQVTAGPIDKGKTKPAGGTALGLATDPTLVMNSDPAIKFFTVAKDRFWMNEDPRAAPYGGSPVLGQVWEGTDNQTRTGAGQETVLSVFAGPIIPDSAKPGAFRAPTEKECIAELRTLYKAYPAKPKTLLKNWPTEPFIKIGYANPGLGQVTTVGRKLTEVYHNRLLFAGEHTSMAFFGYMEGALRSGERAAAAIVKLICPVSGEALVV